ncbi:COG4626 Phage terminase-like protein, large subunit [uncultured Caudovirales phage]|uniref:COG4626 Phage terminase-like protein, large subunit n=1 Tax=uncultured Caudovirales phage TaxID=2100421 RepID=A0A6J5SKU4_9CAUD|nr:COG4626 Phage terminase-like protein, large subunit [uncultured Caudovirales phage]CAB4215225.1 COG4626 Phage terminase-like protein, large subunit [uncultured Caudovirales phage]
MRSSWPPAILTPVSEVERESGDGAEVVSFIEGLCLQVKDSVGGMAGSPMILRDWQKMLLADVFARRADGRRKHRTAIIGMARKNGKSALGSGIALHALMLGPTGGEVYSCAADRDQARIVFGSAKKMIELSPELSSVCTIYRDVIEVVSTGSVYRVLSSEAFTKEGLSPTCVIYDELHSAPNDDLWNVMTLAQAARRDALTIAVTTAGVRSDTTGGDSTAYRQFLYGQQVASGEIVDPSFFMAWWKGDDSANHLDPASWLDANPGFGDLCDAEDFESAVKRTPVNEFRIKRMNSWVSSQHAWLPAASWEGLRTDRVIDSSIPVVLGFDGSFNGDATALIGCTVEAEPFIWVEEVWEKGPGDHESWRVPISEVEARIMQACSDYNVLEVACDPYRWQRSMEALADSGVPISEYASSSPARMVPATAKFYDAVTGSTLSHDGDPTLRRHIGNCAVKTDRLGPRIVKEHRSSSRRIDAAVAAVIAFDRATAARENVQELVSPGFWAT